MRLQVLDSGFGGGDSQLGDTLAKAFFGDPEAAAKVALAKAQIASQGAYATKLGADTSFVQSKQKTEDWERGARQRGAPALGALMQSKLAAPVPVQMQGPVRTGIDAPLPAIVNPVAQQNYETQRNAMPAIAEAAMAGGGNAEQIIKAAGAGAGMAGLLNPTPATVRPDTILYTGNAPGRNDVLMPGDVAGTNADIAINAAKPSAEKIVKDKAGNSYSLETDPTAPGGVKAVPLPGIPVINPGDASLYSGDSVEAQDTNRIAQYILKKQRNEPTSPEEDLAYSIATNRMYGPKTEIRQGPNQESVPVTITPSRPPQVTMGDNGLPAAPGQPGAPTGAPVPGGTPAPFPGPSPAPQPGLPLPALTPTPLATAAPGPAVPAAPAVNSPPQAPVAPAPAAPVPLRQAPAGVGAPGSVSVGAPIIQGKPQQGTEFSMRETGWYGQALGGHQGLDAITPETIPNVLSQWIADPTQPGLSGRILNSFASGPARKFVADSLSFANGLLRTDSGAAIRPEEMPLLMTRFIPVPGDTKYELAWKKANREIALKGLEMGALGEKPNLAQFAAFVDEANRKAGIAEPGGGGGGGGGGGDIGKPPAGISAEEWGAMTPEDRKLFQ